MLKEILHILRWLKELYRFIGKHINGLSKEALTPALEEFEKVESEENRIYTIMEKQIFPFLLANGIEPIVISGSPQEPLEIYKKRMNFQNVYGIQYEKQDGKYTDNCVINTAVSYGKTMVIQEFLKRNPDAKIIFGFGDSEADIPILECASQGFVNKSNILSDRDNIHCFDFGDEQVGEQIIELMTQELERLDPEKYEVLSCVDETGEPTEKYVNRNYFYSGACQNKRVCGVQFWIFDKEGKVLLAERTSGKEQGAGKISAPSGHVQYKRGNIRNERERPIQGCFNEIKEELGLDWNYDNFQFTDDYYPIGIIQRPGKSGENCEMLVKHYALLLADGVKEKIKNNEAKRIFFEPWSSAMEKFGVNDSTPGVYQYFGTNKAQVLSELSRFVNKISLLEKLGADATWDVIALNDWETVEHARKEIDRNRTGYDTWEIISTREDLMYEVDVENTIFDTISTKENLTDIDIEEIIEDNGKVISISKADAIAISLRKMGKEHTIQEFSQVFTTQSDINNVMTIMFKKIPKKQEKEEGFTKGE